MTEKMLAVVCCYWSRYQKHPNSKGQFYKIELEVVLKFDIEIDKMLTKNIGEN